MKKTKTTDRILDFDKDQKKIITWGVLGLSGLAILGTGAWILKEKYQNYERKKALALSMVDGTHQAKAMQFIMAFENDNWFGTGTNEKAVRRIFLGIESRKEYEQIIGSYKALSEGRSLEADIKAELTTTEYEEMKAILASQTGEGSGSDFIAKNLAIRIYNALNATFFGMPDTDDDALKTALDEIPSLTVWNQVAVAYESNFHSNMEEDIDGDLWMWDDLDWEEIKESKALNGFQDSWRRAEMKWRIFNYQNRVRQQKDKLYKRIYGNR